MDLSVQCRPPFQIEIFVEKSFKDVPDLLTCSTSVTHFQYRKRGRWQPQPDRALRFGYHCITEFARFSSVCISREERFFPDDFDGLQYFFRASLRDERRRSIRPAVWPFSKRIHFDILTFDRETGRLQAAFPLFESLPAIQTQQSVGRVISSALLARNDVGPAI
ncbi:MAG: hypothetical protein ACKPJJ_32465, partial [Planctomycetaceae bacterium]